MIRYEQSDNSACGSAARKLREPKMTVGEIMFDWSEIDRDSSGLKGTITKPKWSVHSDGSI